MYAEARDFACRGKMATLLLGLEVVEKDGAFLRLLTPVLDDDAAAVDDLPCVAFAVDLACDDTLVSKTVLSRTASPSSYQKIEDKLTQPSPLAKLLSIRHLDQWNLVLST